jgi:putative hydrolase of HD superfamily
MEKIMKMALVHDVSESRTGDLHHIGKNYTTRDEQKGIRDILKNTSLEKDMLIAWEEYEEKKSIEAKIVKDADTLDVDMELREQVAMGREHLKVWGPVRKVFKDKLFTESAKKLWGEILASDPTKWHVDARKGFIGSEINSETNN